MPLFSNSKTKKKKTAPVQKVVIPRGIINPEETTIIEIPARLHKQPVVVAKRKTMEPNSSCCSNEDDCCPARASRMQFQCSAAKPLSEVDCYSQKQQLTCPSLCHISPHQSHISASCDLEETEQQERMQLQRDLEAFQKARRRLLASASKLTSKGNRKDATYDPFYNTPTSSTYDDNSLTFNYKWS